MWYANSWKTLDSKFDRMTDAGGVKGSEGQDLRALVDASVALHAKWWHLKVALPDARFIWNDPARAQPPRPVAREGAGTPRQGDAPDPPRRPARARRPPRPPRAAARPRGARLPMR